MRILLTLVFVALLAFLNFTSAYAGSGETRTKMAKELTEKYKAGGFPVIFEATGKDKKSSGSHKKTSSRIHWLQKGS